MFGWPRKSRSTSGTGGTRRYWWFCLINFEISSVFMFSRSRNPLLTFLLSYHVRVTSKIQVNFRYRRYSKVLMILSYKFLKFLSVFMFLRSRNPFLTFLLSYHVRVTSKIQVNFRYRRYSKVLMILSYKFLKFLQYLCFWGQEIHFWHSYWATMFGWPWKSRSTSGTGGTDDSVLWIFEISLLFMFSRSMNPLLIFLLSYLVWVTSKIWVNFRF